MKSELRKEFIQKRKNGFDKRASEIITEKVLSLNEYKRAENILCYASYNSEVDTFLLMEQIINDGKKLYLPRCVVEDKRIEVLRARNLSELKEGAYGIPEPTGEGVSPELLDMVIVPMVAFDRKRTRLGYGGGYYDRFLPKTRATRCGIAFSIQESDLLIKEPTDIAMDIIVTEKEVLV